MGFTLLELIVALAVFAVLSVMAYGGLSSVLDLSGATERRAERLGRVLFAVTLLERDLEQAVDRAPRKELGAGAVPALFSDSVDGVLFTLTRAGFPNPLAEPRGDLLRVSYRFADQALERTTWQVLDPPSGSQASHSGELLDGLEAVSVRFLDHGGNWQDRWPPLGPDQEDPGLPRAVELELELENWGTLRRLLALPPGQRSGDGDR